MLGQGSYLRSPTPPRSIVCLTSEARLICGAWSMPQAAAEDLELHVLHQEDAKSSAFDSQGSGSLVPGIREFVQDVAPRC